MTHFEKNFQNQNNGVYLYKQTKKMTNEQILAEFQRFTQEESKKLTEKFKARVQELKHENKVKRVPPKWGLKPNFSTVITDVTPDGYGN